MQDAEHDDPAVAPVHRFGEFLKEVAVVGVAVFEILAQLINDEQHAVPGLRAGDEGVDRGSDVLSLGMDGLQEVIRERRAVTEK